MKYLDTPWGEADYKHVLVWAAGPHGEPLEMVIDVMTPGHGGIGVLREAVDMVLSPEARAYGIWDGRYLWFEEDCMAVIPLYEIAPARAKKYAEQADEEVMAELLKSLVRWNPEYLKERGIQVAA